MDWADRAACLGHDPERWFPHKETPNRVAEPKAICDHCPVASRCLDWALTNRVIHGVWGGTTGQERADILAERTGRATGCRPVDPHRVAEVMQLTEQGQSAKQIAKRLAMNQRVVVRYRARARETAAQAS